MTHKRKDSKTDWRGALIIGGILLLGFAFYLHPENRDPTFPTPTPAPAGFIVQVPQRGYMRSKTIISAEAPTGTDCELIFITPDGVDSQEQGLGKIIADKNGLCI